MTQMTEHFSLEELIASDTAVRKGIDNTPTPEVIGHLQVLAELLEHVRAILKHPLHISSGYRSPALNEAVGGVNTAGHLSAHCLGLAADFTCREFGTPLDIVKVLDSVGLDFDQLIQEGTWVHIATKVSGNRREVLTAHFTNGQKTTYTLGVV